METKNTTSKNNDKTTNKTETTSENTEIKKSDNEELLNAIYLTAKTSANSVEDVVTSAKNTIFQAAISAQHTKYEVIAKECHMLAKALNISLNDVDCIVKFKHWAIVKVGALIDCSTASFAKMLYTGISCQIADLVQKICKFKGADKDILLLAEKLSSLQEQNIHEIKKHLCTKD
ncbi:MAG: hypothetical protein PHC46_04245 [Clostridia bacterium]|nr:hypothetical protein [Clostridia bacterium]